MAQTMTNRFNKTIATATIKSIATVAIIVQNGSSIMQVPGKQKLH